MPIQMMDHYGIRTTKLEATRDFYVDVLGFVEGEHPPFDFPVIWLYPHQGEKSVLHLIEGSQQGNDGLLDYLGGKEESSLVGGGAVDHIAFKTTDLPGMQKHLKETQVSFFEREVPGGEQHQIFLKDPNGITVELNFSID